MTWDFRRDMFGAYRHVWRFCLNDLQPLSLLSDVSCSLAFHWQISEVVNSMKDLMDFCRENKVGPIGNEWCFFFFHSAFESLLLCNGGWFYFVLMGGWREKGLGAAQCSLMIFMCCQFWFLTYKTNLFRCAGKIISIYFLSDTVLHHLQRAWKTFHDMLVQPNFSRKRCRKWTRWEEVFRVYLLIHAQSISLWLCILGSAANWAVISPW